MEAEDKKKKKRNNKKKKNQKAAADDASVAENGQVSSSAAAAADTISNGVQVSGNGQFPKPADNAETNGTERSLLAESENKDWLQKEAKLEEMIKQLEKEKDLQMQKEATLEGTIKELQKQRDSLIQKEATLEGTIKLLQDEKDAHMQKEVTLEDTIKQLQEETDSHIHLENILQKEIVQLRSEKDSWLKKEVGLEEKIRRLVDKKSTLDSEEASLQEKIKHLQSDRDNWNLKEDSFKEMIATQTDNIAKLRAQVLELEQSRDNLVQENQQLMGNLSSLELQIKDRESVSSSRASVEGAKHAAEREELNSQIEAACALVEKLITENADLVEKMNELYVELERHSAKGGLPLSTAVLPGETAIIINPMPRSSEDMSTSGQKLYSSEVVPHKVETPSYGNMDSQQAALLQSNGNLDIQHPELVPNSPISYESRESEIMQIPLDASEVQDLELQSATEVTNEAVSITDAPLIGAPFRLVSFVARYVSGADLISKS
ncbi:PREDICTED: kinesin-like protein KIF20B isoform X1 [Fragaria vesca subsp. vesca]|uniref:kinesin-like protein KIF20B isoform X1 n=1 Tax=Fragaria vesca subsp. vesca TaxID=101020 RepID=UPI0002C351D3|nr:PREDICTED: kinesin-like protein KIF20B isoform X1 [Fragaria vesca subsp. vesca]